MKTSGIEKATFALLLLSLGFSAVAQQAPPAASPPEAFAEDSAEVSPDEVSADDEAGYVRILHFERPVSLDDIEAGRVILDSDPFGQSAEPILPPAPAPFFVNLAPEERAYLQRLRDIESYEQALEQLEYNGGAWSPELAEELADLGALLYEQGEFEESIKVFDRAVHVNRVNNGLYSPQQIPLVEQQIAGHIALDQWREADELQQYAFYAQTRAFGPGDPRMIPVYQRLAQWNLVLFFRQVDENPTLRLQQTYQLFRAAALSVNRHFGPRDPRYTRLLRDIAGASDMVSRFALPGQATPTTANPGLRTVRTDYAGGNFGTRASEGHSGGEVALLDLVDYYGRRQDQGMEAFLMRIEATAALGDWYQMHNRRQAAQRAYKDAYVALAGHEQAGELLQDQFGHIVFLPTFSTFDEQKKQALGLTPDSGARQGYVDMSFSVTKYGRVDDLAVLAIEPPGIERVEGQVASHLRAYTVRPRIVEGEAVDSKGERYRFPFWY